MILAVSQIAEISKIDVQEMKEAKKLLEQSVEELERTVTALSTQVYVIFLVLKLSVNE